jgi:hypothetical protein
MEYISDTLAQFEILHKECTKQLLSLPVPFEFAHLIIEVLHPFHF